MSAAAVTSSPSALLWHQDSPGIQGTALMDDQFGWTLAPRR
jgi:hypothetical protein